MAMLEVKNLGISFGGLRAVDGLDMTIEKGELYGLIGPNGAGKTTLLQILGTLSAPDAGGSVLFDGQDLTAWPDRRLSAFRNRNLGFVFQSHRLLPEFSILENVALPALIGGTPRAKALDEARSRLERLGLGDRSSHLPSQLSGGECQRAAVARALVNGASLILADEPSGSLDMHNRSELHRLFFDLRDNDGVTFVVVTHDEHLAADSDVIVNMADGRIISITDNTVDNSFQNRTI